MFGRDPRQQAVIDRMSSMYVRQRMICLVVGVLVSSIPLTIALTILPLGLLAWAALVVFIFGVWALCDGTADHSIRRSIQIGAWASYFLLAFAPVSLYVVFTVQWPLGFPAMLLWVASGVATCIGYPYFERRYRRYVESVYSPNKSVEPTR
jgi:hypothetical protein